MTVTPLTVVLAVIANLFLIAGMWITARWKYKGDTQTSAGKVLTDVFRRLKAVEDEVASLRDALLQLRWRYQTSLSNLQEHRDLWPSDKLDVMPSVDPIIETDLRYGPQPLIIIKEVQSAEPNTN